MGKIRRVAKEIMETLKKVSASFDFEGGVEVEIIPKPVVKLYAKIFKYRSLKKGKNGGNREKNNNRHRDDDESARK